MSALVAELLVPEFERRGVELRLVDDRVRYRPRAAVDEELLSALKAHRADVLVVLRDTYGHERRLDIEPVDGIEMIVVVDADHQRRWQLRRDGEVLAETEPEDHVTAREWIAALQGGEIPSVRDAGFGIHHPVHPSATPEPTPDSEPNEPRQPLLPQ